jgi:hypothetical protein
MMSYDADFKMLSWEADTYDAVSGPWGLGPLPKGQYVIRVRDVVTKSPKAGYTDPLTNDSWFIPIKPNFQTSRSGFGIHPDGNVPGTEGCIGLRGKDASKFWEKWNSIALDLLPATLTVT